MWDASQQTYIHTYMQDTHQNKWRWNVLTRPTAAAAAAAASTYECILIHTYIHTYIHRWCWDFHSSSSLYICMHIDTHIHTQMMLRCSRGQTAAAAYTSPNNTNTVKMTRRNQTRNRHLHPVETKRMAKIAHRTTAKLRRMWSNPSWLKQRLRLSACPRVGLQLRRVLWVCLRIRHARAWRRSIREKMMFIAHLKPFRHHWWCSELEETTLGTAL